MTTDDQTLGPHAPALAQTRQRHGRGPVVCHGLGDVPQIPPRDLRRPDGRRGVHHRTERSHAANDDPDLAPLWTDAQDHIRVCRQILSELCEQPVDVIAGPGDVRRPGGVGKPSSPSKTRCQCPPQTSENRLNRPENGESGLGSRIEPPRIGHTAGFSRPATYGSRGIAR